MKTPEEMAFDYGEKFDGVEISKNDINIAWYEGYEAAQEHAHAALEEAEAKIQELQDQLADADKVMPDTCEHILDMEKMVDVNSSDNSKSWISVKDRLPEVGISVLLIVADGGFVTSGWLSPQLPVFECAYGRVYWPKQITYWMPLPEPPKEQQ